MREAIRHRARELGFDDCRFTTARPPASAPLFQRWLSQGCHGDMGYLSRNASKRIDPQQVLPGAKSIIVLAVSYSADGPPPADANSEPAKGLSKSTGKDSGLGIVARYAQYEDYHEVVGSRLRSLTEFINQLAGQGVRSIWYTDTGPILERDLAQRAGLGFVGKHTNLISRRYGNWILLAEIFTTAEFEPDQAEPNRCGACVRCLAACPTQAITGPFQLDARRCISYLTIELKSSIPVELRPAIGNRIFGCDDCLAVCPWNRFAGEGKLMRGHSRPDLTQPELLDLLCLNQAQFKRRFDGTPLMRTKRRGLLRNVCVALGNTGDEAALPALERAAADPEPLVVEHARWAIDEIRNRKLPRDHAGANPT